MLTSDMRSDWLSPNPLHIADPLDLIISNQLKQKNNGKIQNIEACAGADGRKRYI